MRDHHMREIEKLAPAVPVRQAEKSVHSKQQTQGALRKFPAQLGERVERVGRARAPDLAIVGPNARVLADASSGIVVSQTGRIISLIGVHDIVVVDTPDALLVTTKENAQRVKSVVDALKLSGRNEVL